MPHRTTLMILKDDIHIFVRKKTVVLHLKIAPNWAKMHMFCKIMLRVSWFDSRLMPDFFVKNFVSNFAVLPHYILFSNLMIGNSSSPLTINFGCTHRTLSWTMYQWECSLPWKSRKMWNFWTYYEREKFQHDRKKTNTCML